jgi:hypothetical protein
MRWRSSCESRTVINRDIARLMGYLKESEGEVAMTTHKEKHPHADKSEKQIDKEVEDSFPASDPPSTGGTTKIVPDERAPAKHKPSADKPDAH